MTKWITTDTGLITGVVTGVFLCQQAFPTLEVADAPDGLVPGWTLNGSVWEPGAALLASDALALANAAKKAALKEANQIATLRSWAAEATEIINNPAKWDVWTTAQRFAALRVVITRLGTFFDKVADDHETS